MNITGLYRVQVGGNVRVSPSAFHLFPSNLALCLVVPGNPYHDLADNYLIQSNSFYYQHVINYNLDKNIIFIINCFFRKH